MVTIPSTNPQCSHPSLDQKTIEAAKYLAANGVAINPNAFPEEIIQAAHSISIQIAQAANAANVPSREDQPQRFLAIRQAAGAACASIDQLAPIDDNRGPP